MAGGKLAAPAVSEGVVYTCGYDASAYTNLLYAVDAARGTLLWTARTGSASGCTPPTVANGFVYVDY